MRFEMKVPGCGRVAWAAVLVLGAVLLAAPVSAQSPPNAIQRGFELIDDYLLAVDGEESAGARIYRSTQTAAILILRASATDAPILIWPRAQQVESLNFMKVQKAPGGFAEIKTDPVVGRHGGFQVVGTNVIFNVDGVEMRLMPKPALIGSHDAAAMLASSKVYENRAEAYSPNQAVLDRLAQAAPGVSVKIFFGSWCPACGRAVPLVLNVAERLSESAIDFEFYGLPRGQGFNGDAEAARFNVKQVPTGVVLVDDKEIGRLEGVDWREPETALANLLGL